MTLGGWCFVIGTVLFSGSISPLSPTGTKFLGIVTPIGGAIWMIGWLSIALGVLRAR